MRDEFQLNIISNNRLLPYDLYLALVGWAFITNWKGHNK